MYKIFDTLEQYNQFTDNGTHLTAGILYIVKENKSLYFITNNIDGEAEKYEYLDEIPEGYIIPTGNIAITENGENIDVNDYATASVNVPIPEGYIKPTGNKTITQNGTNIDVNNYATASVNVPIPEGYIKPTGNKTITQNGTNIDVNNYATATVDVAPNLTTQNITENGTYQPSGNYDGFSSVTVNVPQPTGNISITENGENIDIAQYATATVNVAGSGGNEDLINLIERDITSITIPSGTTAIGDNAFSSCKSLTSITIPNSVRSIGEGAFSDCSGLKNITIPDSVTSIGESAFQSCEGLTSVTIGRGVTSIGYQTFQFCSGLTSITIPDRVRIIGNAAFQQCGLTNITIPDRVTSIGYYAFYNCSDLTSVTIEATTPPTLGSNAFSSTGTNLIIYVPAESVNTYKAATNWSTYASRIRAIA